MKFRIKRRPGGKAHEGLISWQGGASFCSLGRNGVTAFKREGDGATPIGHFRMLYGFFRNDRLGLVRSGLPLEAISLEMGWCDSSTSPAYNQLVRLPFTDSHEEMMRKDRLYDVCIVLDYNIDPRARQRGSAIFFHISRPDFGPTEGCVAIEPDLMLKLLPRISQHSTMTVLAE